MRIQLRDWSLDDLADFEHWQKPGHLWKSLNGPYYETNVDESMQEALELRSRIVKNDFPTPRMRMVIADTQTNKLIGFVSSYWESKETNWLCIGIVIYDDKYWSKGIGQEAMSLWIDYLFANRPEIVRLDMRTWSGNHGLIKLAGKLGFKQEACFRKARIVDGKYYDGLGFGILKEEWSSPSRNVATI